MDFDPSNSRLYFTKLERYLLGIGQDKAFPLYDVDDLLDDALNTREALVDGNGPEADLEIVENLIVELGSLQEYVAAPRSPRLTHDPARFAGCAALSGDTFTNRQSMRRHRNAFTRSTHEDC
ncbi:MAG TPA: hypothetical protein VN778_01805 [Verrucomicrobiae bacterium]|nr:hypothetical protein [Verrucomicrobiae bacterium]